MITPALHRLKQMFPEAQIDVLIGDWSSPVLHNNPNISRVLSIPDRWLSLSKPWNFTGLMRLLIGLRSERYDGVLVFHHNIAIRAFGQAVSAPVTIAYHPRCNNSHRFSLWDTHQHGVLNAITLVTAFCREMGIEVTQKIGDNAFKADWVVTKEESNQAWEILAKAGVDKPPIFINPGAGSLLRVKANERQWFPEKFASLINKIEQQHLGPVLLGGIVSDQTLSEKIQALSPYKIGSIVGKTNLRELAAVLSISQLLITNDTGTMHIGGAVGIPLIAIFGPTGSEQKIPLGGPFEAVQSQVPCSPCYYGAFRGCLFKEYECMKEITVERVLDSALKLLERVS